MTRRSSRLDTAYGCFLACGVAVLLGALIEVIPKSKDEGTAAILVFFVYIPLAFFAIATMIAGTVLWIILPKDWALAGMSLVSILFVATLLSGRGSLLIAAIYGSAVVTACGAWFAVFRKRCGASLANAVDAVEPPEATDRVEAGSRPPPRGR